MTKIVTAEPLGAEALGGDFDPDTLGFATTKELEPLDAWPGQDRALGAIRMAAKVPHSTFNLFVLGNAGSGRHEATRAELARAAAERDNPNDWVYVNNFDDPRRPKAIRLSSGKAEELRKVVEKLIDDLANDLPALFESEDYQTRRRSVEEEFSKEQEAAMTELAEKARARSVAILRTPMGFAVAALRDGEVLTPEAYRELPPEEREKIDEAVGKTEDELEAILKHVPKRVKDQRRKVEELNVAMAEGGVDAAISDAMAQFEGQDEVIAFFKAMRKDMIENAELFLIQEEGARAGGFPVATTKHYTKPQFQRYLVNVVVSQADGQDGAPVVVETLPTLSNLIGRIEYISHQGTLVTNFTMIRPGALHRANGGYLVLDARQLLTEPFAWDALKRCIRTGEIKIFSAGERLSLISTVSLEPDPVPLSVRVVLVGERILYYLLTALDPEFPRLFKLEADFDDIVPRSPETRELFARLSASIVRREGLSPIRADGVGRLLLESARVADDAERFTLNIGKLSDLLCEADHWAREAGAEAIREEDIETAIAAADRRAGRIRELSEDAVARGTLLIDMDGARVGQINALSVIDLGGTRFGRPSRVTARVRVGSGKVVDIERETELGGPIHSKGVMILSGYLAGHCATELPMSLWASLVFEQSYGGVEGDSASAAELFALLSALANLPIDQSFAVTGSVNQFGDVQAIGGVNEKIEGFFDTCARAGLTGRQGVLIPVSNVKHLVLRDRVVNAVREGKFRIIPIGTIDEGISLLTGRPAGDRDSKGAFPEDSVNGLVEARLTEFAEVRRRFGQKRGKEGEDE
ncbi:ATP-binding protein [Ostreiculturibacter nitratireducens]|uniref:Lon protease family protein n=1 Tax=Ostreiculturibacter nitratireducens TaxID=3075226 RepID=UPI0031B615D9